jgi:hypothetical protein
VGPDNRLSERKVLITRLPRNTNLALNLPQPMLTIKLEKDEVSPHLRRLLRMAESNGPLANVLGRAGANELRRHFRGRNGAQANKLGGKRTNFWSAVASSVQAPRLGARGITIPITHPAIGQKVRGGVIRARKTKNLAIPIHPQAHGKSPRVMDLTFAMTKAGVKLLGTVDNAGNPTWLYVLKPSVSQRPDPHALPTARSMGEVLERAGRLALRKV